MDRLRNMEEKIGYLIAKVEEIQADQKALAEKVDKLEEEVHKKFTTAETVLKTFKYLGAVVLAVATFQFGDIPGLWTKLFG